MKSLFENKIRTDTKPAKHVDNTFDFYDRSCSPKINAVRNLLNNWFDKYPEDEKDELRLRFKNEFDETLYELFLHELFLKQGFKLCVHPTVPNTSKRPDFLVSKNGTEFYLEAKVAKDKSSHEKSIENKIGSLYDSLNKINSPNFFLRILDLQFKSTKQPNSKKAIAYIEKELSKFDPDEIIKLIPIDTFSIDGLPKIEYQDDDFKILLSIIPKSSQGRGQAWILPIGIYPNISFIGGSAESIKSSFEKKALRYGDIDKPYIICINSSSDKWTSDYDAFNALFGSLQVTWSSDPNNQDERLERAKDGIFLGKDGPQYTRVSGALITRFNIGSLYETEYWFAKHPFAKRELDFHNFDLSYISIVKNKIEIVSKKIIGDILDISKNWLKGN